VHLSLLARTVILLAGALLFASTLCIADTLFPIIGGGQATFLGLLLIPGSTLVALIGWRLAGLQRVLPLQVSTPARFKRNRRDRTGGVHS
jgi:hypothetical protein